MIQPHPVQIVFVLDACWNLSFIVPKTVPCRAWLCLFRLSRVSSMVGGGGKLGALTLGAEGMVEAMFFAFGAADLNKLDPYGTSLAAPEASVAVRVPSLDPSPLLLCFAKAVSLSLAPCSLSADVSLGAGRLLDTSDFVHGGFGVSTLAGSPHGSDDTLDCDCLAN